MQSTRPHHGRASDHHLSEMRSRRRDRRSLVRCDRAFGSGELGCHSRRAEVGAELEGPDGECRRGGEQPDAPRERLGHDEAQVEVALDELR